ncbi:MAG: UDP-N-acetylglucosamine pyrophosphorylase [Ruminococcaceae bacterium]|nr:UDP-N-acetylglucosamine pyrophosphorylase [Oscillospiraceae bacterium]
MTQIHPFFPKSLFDPTASLLYDRLAAYPYPWEILRELPECIKSLGKILPDKSYHLLSPGIWIGENVNIAPTACINGPCIIGHNTEIRHCAYIRGNAVIGENCVIGNSTEVKNAILFDRTQIPHYNYVGDSILGKGTHLGAGTVISNLKSDGSAVNIPLPEGKLNTDMRKFGALIGDGTEVGCSCVLNPGTIIGKGCRIYPLNSIRGVIPEKHIYKNREEITPILESKHLPNQ